MKIFVKGSVCLARYSPDGRHLAVVSNSSRYAHAQAVIQIYEVDSWEQPCLRFCEEAFLISALAWAPDGRSLAYSGEAGVARVWNLANSIPLVAFTEHSPEIGRVPECCTPQRRAVSALAWQNEEHIVSAGNDECLRKWNASTGQTIHWRYCPHLPSRLVFSPRADFFAALASAAPWPDDEESISGQVALYETRTNSLVGTLPESNQMFCGAWSPDGSRLALGNWDMVQIWRTSVSEPPSLSATIAVSVHAGTTTFAPSLHVLAWSPDGQKLACSTEWDRSRSHLDWHAMARASHLVEIWNAEGKWLWEAPAGIVSCLDWSPDGNYLVVGEEDGCTILQPYHFSA